MMPVIRISDENFGRLKQWAEPLEDSADQALGKALDAAELVKSNECIRLEKPINRQDTSVDKALPASFYRDPLLETLYQMGGKERTKSIKPRIYEMVETQLGKADHGRRRQGTGEEIWWNNVCWERDKLVKEGLFRADSQQGVWELSAEGTEYVEQHILEGR